MRKLTAQPPYTMLVANLESGSDPSRGRAGRAVKVRSTFTQQYMPEVVDSQVGFFPAPSPVTLGTTTFMGLLSPGYDRSAVDITVVDDDFSERAYLTVGPYTFASFVDYDPQDDTKATGSLVVTTNPATATITIGGENLTPAGGARTSGSNDYNNTLGTPTLIAADIVAAINDPANGFDGMVSALSAVATVYLVSVLHGATGNSTTLASNNGTVTLSAATLTGGVDAVDNTATELAAALSGLPGFSATSVGPVVTLQGPVGANANRMIVATTYNGTVQNFELSAPNLEGGSPVSGPPDVE